MRSARKALWYALTAALITAFVVCPSQYLGLVRSLYPRGVWKPAIIISTEYVSIVLIAAFSAALASAGPGLRLRDAEAPRNILRAVSISIWTAPLMVLLLQHSVLSGLVAAGIVIGAFTTVGITAERLSDAGVAFQTLDSRMFVKLLALAIAGSGLLQAAVLADWIAERDFALLLFAFGAALLAARLPAANNDRYAPDSTFRIGKRAFASVTAATGLVMAGLLVLMMPVGSGERSLDALFRKWSSGAVSDRIVQNHSVRLEQTPIRGDGYIGVILTPPRKEQKQLIVPPELRLARRIGGFSHPLRIRFTGSYWFFQHPFLGPPFDSIEAEGDPAKIGVRTSNYRSLQMEAVQTLDESIDTTELATIQLTMLDEDTHPGSVSVELVLADIRIGNHMEQSLGSQPLNTSPSIENAVNSHYETLTFLVPAQSRCKQFNQIRLIFRLAPFRNQQAAAVAVEDFVLVPRGV